MAYTYTVEVKTTPESILLEIETELYDFFHVKSKVEEVLNWTFDVPVRIRKEILRALDLPSNINIGYVLEKSQSEEWEISCIPTSFEDLEFSIS